MTFLFLLGLGLSIVAQPPVPQTKSACEQRAQIVMRTLEPDNALRDALERGQRGDCVHQPWMDSMRRFGIRQASFLVEYVWKHNEVSFRIKKISYLAHYYSQYDRAITGRSLREVRKSGLERRLMNIVLARTKKGPFAVRHPDQVAKDVF